MNHLQGTFEKFSSPCDQKGTLKSQIKDANMKFVHLHKNPNYLFYKHSSGLSLSHYNYKEDKAYFHLNCANSHIKSLEDLAYYIRVKPDQIISIIATHNALSGVLDLDKLLIVFSNLKELHLDHNKIETILCVKPLPKEFKLDLSHNWISDISHFSALDAQRKDCVIDLSYNKLSKKTLFRLKKSFLLEKYGNSFKDTIDLFYGKRSGKASFDGLHAAKFRMLVCLATLGFHWTAITLNALGLPIKNEESTIKINNQKSSLKLSTAPHILRLQKNKGFIVSEKEIEPLKKILSQSSASHLSQYKQLLDCY